MSIKRGFQLINNLKVPAHVETLSDDELRLGYQDLSKDNLATTLLRKFSTSELEIFHKFASGYQSLDDIVDYVIDLTDAYYRLDLHEADKARQATSLELDEIFHYATMYFQHARLPQLVRPKKETNKKIYWSSIVTVDFQPTARKLSELALNAI